MNILILSSGTRNKIIQYYKKALNGIGNLILTDCSNLAPSLYEADKFYIVPKMTDDNYLETIFEICRKEKINGVFSLIDPELSLISKNSNKFLELGVKVIGSPYDLCELSLNKWEMFKWLTNNGFNCAKTYIDKEAFYKDLNDNKIDFPVFVKPVCGSASICISKAYNKQTVELLFSQNENLIIQQFLNGQEIGADCYIDLISKELVAIFTKKKIIMRAGETDKAVSFKDEKLFDLIKNFVKKSGFVGQIDIDIFDVDGKYYISEVNPRYGGGYPHAYECGVDTPSLVVNNLLGKKNTPNIGNYKENVYMMKYNEVMVKNL